MQAVFATNLGSEVVILVGQDSSVMKEIPTFCLSEILPLSCLEIMFSNLADVDIRVMTKAD